MKSPKRRRQRERLDPGRLRSFGQCRNREVAGRIVVAHDIEASQRYPEENGGEVIGRERGDHGQIWQNASQRQHGLDAFAGRHDVARYTEPDAVPEQMTHCAPRRVDRCFVAARRVEPSAMRAGYLAGEVGDGGDQRRPDLGRRIGIGPVIAAGVEAQRCGIVQSRNAALAQIRFCDCPRNRLRHREAAVVRIWAIPSAPVAVDCGDQPAVRAVAG